MTLKEKLDQKVGEENRAELWNQIQNLFLNADFTKLQRGLNIDIYTNDDSTIFYCIDPENNYTGKRFDGKYSEFDLECALEKCMENGIQVNPIARNFTVYRLTYRP